MNVYDGCLWVWLLFAIFLGFRQGLSVIILRFVLGSVGFALFPFLTPHVNSMIKEMLSAESSPTVSVIVLSVLMIFLVEVIVWGFCKLRSVMLLTIPDRIAGAVVGLFVGVVLGMLGSMHLAKSSSNVEKMIQESATAPVYNVMEPVMLKVSEPIFELREKV